MCPIAPPDHRKTPMRWIVDDDGDVFLEGMGIRGKVIDREHIRISESGVLMHCPPDMVPVKLSEIDWTKLHCPQIPLSISNVDFRTPDRKALYVDVGSVGERYPHKCPNCDGPAYIGLMSVDCLRKCH